MSNHSSPYPRGCFLVTPHSTRMVVDYTSPILFRVLGERIVGRVINGRDRSYVALFGIPPLKVYQLWRLIYERNNRGNTRTKCYPKHLLWALLLLRTYNREEVLAALVGVTEKTYRKWAQDFEQFLLLLFLLFYFPGYG